MFLPDNIDLGQPEKYILSIRIAENSFMFSIVEPGNEKSYCFRETTFSSKSDILEDIKRIIFDLNFLTQEFKQTNVIFVTEEYDLIPASYFEVKNQKKMHDFIHTNKSEHLLSGLLDKQDIIVSYNVKQEIFEFLSRNLWSPHFFHHSHLMINWLGNKGGLTNLYPKMYTYFHDGMMDLFCFSGGKLTLSLTYKDESAKNLLYFILKVWENSGFDQMTDYLFVIGQSEKLLIKRLEEYIKNIEYISIPSEAYLWSEDVQKAPIDLLTLVL